MSLGARSEARLATCAPELQILVRAIATDVHAGLVPGVSDLTVLCGHRGEAEQEEAFRAGASKLHWPHSKHNSLPSRAVDLAPYPTDWADREAFLALRAHVARVAKRLGIKIRHISWDLPHTEIL